VTNEPDVLARRNRALRAASEGNWFFVVAALSVTNVILQHLGIWLVFVGALSAPVIVSSYAYRVSSGLSMAQANRLYYGCIAVCVVILVVLGWFARRGHIWAFVLGVLLYLADGLAILMYRDYPMFLIHLVILYFMLSGLIGLLRSRRPSSPAPAAPAPPAPEPAPDKKPSRPGSLYPH
jgi:hypothetical protein